MKSFIYLNGEWFQGVGVVRAHAVYLNHQIDLLTGKKTLDRSLESVLTEWLGFSFSEKCSRPIFAYLFYELGHIFESSSKLSDQTLLAVFIEYEKLISYRVENSRELYFENIYSPDFASYEQAFNKGYDHLLKGNCYQFNLTYPFIYKSEGELRSADFLGALKSASPYAHACDLEELGISIFSNSPESLFEREGEHTLVTRPIKGTLAKGQGSAEALSMSTKDMAELDMITDLLRNDLNRIERASAKVRARHKLLEVPGLYHQYSEVALDVRKGLELKKIVTSLFPSGSVTGAPKKRVMEILADLEETPRGIYCGSTLFALEGTLRASVNIRTALYDHKEKKLEYHAGGGCTLLSSAANEYEEMKAKVASFFTNLL